MILGFAAMSGFGKSYGCQAISELNTEEYDHVVVLDFKDEYRGLCSKEHGPAPAKHWIAGPVERDHFTRDHWRQLVEQNGHVVIARHQTDLDVDDWREEVVADVVAAVRPMGNVLVVIDEAHFVAPQSGKVPDEIIGLATTGRGEGASSIWVTQRLSKLDEDIVGLWNARFFGAFGSDNDLKKLRNIVEYPVDVHKPGGTPVSGLPAELSTDEGDISLRKDTVVLDDGTEQVRNSEWIYSNDDGDLQRGWSNDLWSPECDHVGTAGRRIEVGF